MCCVDGCCVYYGVCFCVFGFVVFYRCVAWCCVFCVSLGLLWSGLVCLCWFDVLRVVVLRCCVMYVALLCVVVFVVSFC